MTTKLSTNLRDKVGSRWARRLRLQGLIPASLQGDGANQNVAIPREAFLAARRHHEHVFELELPSGSEMAMIRELQWSPLGDEILHVEFHRVELGKETEAEVQIEFSGHPKGGVLNHLVTHVTVAAIPTRIPDSIEMNVDHLEIGHALTAGDLPMPEGVRLITEAETPVATVSEVRGEVAPAATEEAEAAEAGEATGEAASPAGEG